MKNKRRKTPKKTKFDMKIFKYERDEIISLTRSLNPIGLHKFLIEILFWNLNHIRPETSEYTIQETINDSLVFVSDVSEEEREESVINDSLMTVKEMEEYTKQYYIHREIDLFKQKYYSDRRLDCIRILLSVGADPNYKKAKPLIEAIRSNRPECVKVLLVAGASPNANGGEPLFWSIWRGNTDIVNSLLLFGADPLALNKTFRKNIKDYENSECYKMVEESIKSSIFKNS